MPPVRVTETSRIFAVMSSVYQNATCVSYKSGKISYTPFIEQSSLTSKVRVTNKTRKMLPALIESHLDHLASVFRAIEIFVGCMLCVGEKIDDAVGVSRSIRGLACKLLKIILGHWDWN